MGWFDSSTPLEELSRVVEGVLALKQVRFVELMRKVEDCEDQSIRQWVWAIQDHPKIMSTLACSFWATWKVVCMDWSPMRSFRQHLPWLIVVDLENLWKAIVELDNLGCCKASHRSYEMMFWSAPESSKASVAIWDLCVLNWRLNWIGGIASSSSSLVWIVRMWVVLICLIARALALASSWACYFKRACPFARVHVECSLWRISSVRGS